MGLYELIDLALDRDKFEGLLNTVTKLQLP
jgi:hypothetical protein